MAIIMAYMNGECQIEVDDSMMCRRPEEKKAIWDNISGMVVREAVRQETEREGDVETDMGKGPYAG